MKYLPALSLLALSLLYSHAWGHGKKHAPQLLTSRHTQNSLVPEKTRLIHALVVGCIERKKSPGARAEIFEFFIQSDSLKGAPEKLAREICLAEYDGLDRIATISDTVAATQKGELLHVESPYITWPTELAHERRVLRSWAAGYLTALAERMHTKGMNLRVTSLTRPVDLQNRLAKSGATPARCDTEDMRTCGTHTTGAAFDISTRTLTNAELLLLKDELSADMKLGRIIFIQEIRGAHFHIFVARPQ